jgi:tetratricopeptide (TPR) repeat protein
MGDRAADADAGLASFGLESETQWLDCLRRAEGDLPLGFLAGYELLEEIGRGGQGIVYRARQPGTERTVAVKRLTAGAWATAAARARFDREMRAAASLDHPGVVAVYQCAFDGAQPVLVMEHVDGVPIDGWRSAAPRSLREIVELMARVGDAVAHAHRRGVIHRDIKPSNVLVDASGAPHVLDFGLARVLEEEAAAGGAGVAAVTADGGFLGTPAFASPEQLAGAASDTRSDVYALGAILFGLVTGRPLRDPRLPLGATLDAARRDAAPRPSSIEPAASRELDAIVGKALAIDPAERYASADALAADLRRLLAGEVVLAHPPTASYQLRKIVARHRGLVASAGAVLLAIVGGLIGVSLALVQTQAARETAAAAERTARQVGEFLNEVLASGDPTVVRAYDVPVSVLLDGAVERLDGGALADQPEAEATVRATIGDTYRSLGMYPQARAQVQRAIDLREAALGPGNVEVADLMLRLSWLLLRDEEFDEAARLADRAAEIRRDHFGEDHPLVMEAILARAKVWSTTGENAMARDVLCALLPRAIAATGGEATELVVEVKGDLGYLQGCANTVADGIRLLTETLEAQRAMYGADDERIARTLLNMSAHRFLGEAYDEAERLAREALAMRRRLYGDDHPAVASALWVLASAVQHTRGLAEEERCLREALAIQERRLVPGHYETARSRGAIGVSLLQQGRAAEAEPLLKQAIRELDGKRRRGALRASGFRRWLATALYRQDRFFEAEAILLEALREAELRFPGTGERREVVGALAALYEAWGRTEDAARWRAEGASGRSG